MTHRIGRIKKMYVQDYHRTRSAGFRLCVPSNRPKGSWTNGVQAWERTNGGGEDIVIGWFYPPRLRQTSAKSLEAKVIYVTMEEFLYFTAGLVLIGLVAHFALRDD